MRTPLPRIAMVAMLASIGLPAQAQVFTPVVSPAIAAHVAFSLGATWVDYDGDGDLDLYVVTGFAEPRDNALYRNDGGTFVAVTGVPLVQDGSDTACSAWADIDNDGDLDAFVSNLAVGDGRLYVASSPGVLTPDATVGIPAICKGVGCAWGDYDNDGFVDLVIAALYGQGGIDTGNRLFHNDGDGSFTEIHDGPVVNTFGTHHHPTWADYDGDGDLDLFFATGSISGGTNPDHMYRNLKVETGTATFEALTTGIIVTESRSSQCLQWIDYDNDDDLDLFAVNYNTVPCQLYRNDGATFTKITTGALVTDPGNMHGATWGTSTSTATSTSTSRSISVSRTATTATTVATSSLASPPARSSTKRAPITLRCRATTTATAISTCSCRPRATKRRACSIATTPQTATTGSGCAWSVRCRIAPRSAPEYAHVPRSAAFRAGSCG